MVMPSFKQASFILNSSTEETAQRIVQLVKYPELGRQAPETVKQRFLMIHLLERYLELLGGFETSYRLTDFQYARKSG
jgi:trehalose synthase